MIINLWALHHNEKEWDQPDRFMPGEFALSWPLAYTASLDSAPPGRNSFLHTKLPESSWLQPHRPVVVSFLLKLRQTSQLGFQPSLQITSVEVCRHLSPRRPVPPPWIVAFPAGDSSSSLPILSEYLISSCLKSRLRFSGQKLGPWLMLPFVPRALLRSSGRPSHYTHIKLPALWSWSPLLCRRGAGPSGALPLHGLAAAEV